MANTNSIKKVQEYLESKKEPVTLSKITIQNGLSKKAVLEVLDILKQYKNIQTLTNGKITLIQLKQEKENAGATDTQSI